MYEKHVVPVSGGSNVVVESSDGWGRRRGVEFVRTRFTSEDGRLSLSASQVQALFVWLQRNQRLYGQCVVVEEGVKG